MRLGLIGSTGHWQTYAPALGHVPGLTLVAVAAAGPEETTGAFDHAPGLTVDTHRYDDAQKMLDKEKLDVVQVSGEAGAAERAEPEQAPDVADARHRAETAGRGRNVRDRPRRGRRASGRRGRLPCRRLRCRRLRC